MESTISSIVPLVATYFGILGGIWTLFDRAESVINAKSKSDLTKWLVKKRKDQRSNWPAVYIAIFDSLLGKNRLTFSFFLRSFWLSLFMMFILGAMIYSVEGQKLFHYFTTNSSTLSTKVLDFVILTIVTNAIPDFISLLQTRLFVQWMRNKPAIFRFSIIIFDFLISASIVVIMISVFFTVHPYILKQGWSYLFDQRILMIFSEIIAEVPEATQNVLRSLRFWDLENPNAPLSIWVFSTLYGSICVWFSMISGYVFESFHRALEQTGLSRKLDINRHPLRSLALLFMTFVTGLFCITLLIE